MAAKFMKVWTVNGKKKAVTAVDLQELKQKGKTIFKHFFHECYVSYYMQALPLNNFLKESLQRIVIFK